MSHAPRPACYARTPVPPGCVPILYANQPTATHPVRFVQWWQGVRYVVRYGVWDTKREWVFTDVTWIHFLYVIESLPKLVQMSYVLQSCILSRNTSPSDVCQSLYSYDQQSRIQFGLLIGGMSEILTRMGV